MKDKIEKDFMEALRNKDTKRKTFLGIIKGEIQTEEKRGKTVDIESILRKMEKSLKATNDTEAQEQLLILQDYLPKLMSYDEIQTIVKNYFTLVESDKSKKNIADIMRLFNSVYKGKADNKLVMEIIKENINE